MFMNFDCELEESNLFERTTWSLKVGMMRLPGSKPMRPAERTLRPLTAVCQMLRAGAG